jgi:hypothetical protein
MTAPPRGERRGYRPTPLGRKLVLTCFALGLPFITCTIALFIGKLSGGEYVTFCATTLPMGLGAFHASNVVQKFKLAENGVDPNG